MHGNSAIVFPEKECITHEAIEKAFQKFKEHPVKYGIKAAEAVGTATGAVGGISMIVEVVDEHGGFKTYDVKLEHNDDGQRLDIYVDGGRVGVIPYKNIANLEEDEVNTTIKICTDVAIAEYQVRHESST